MDREGHPGSDGRSCALVAPLTMFKAMRMQMDELGLEPDYRIRALSDLAGLLSPAAKP